MKPEKRSQALLGVTRSKAKMFEYDIPEKYHISVPQDPAKLFRISIGILGDVAAKYNLDETAPEDLIERRRNLNFSAYFFDAYLESRLNDELDPYLILLGSASYYLCDLPGSSRVLCKKVGERSIDIEGEGLENLLHWLLQGDFSSYLEGSPGPFGEYIDLISHKVYQFFSDGVADDLFQLCKQLRKFLYASGTPRQLLLGDVLSSIVREKHRNSAWNTLPMYSDLTKDQWREVILKDSFAKELWPAQHLLGKAGVLKGKSAAIQMPTSAGKTKATELIIRSAFLAGRTSLTIIVAPFRALCHEIKNSLFAAFRDEAIKVEELTDVMQADFEIVGHPNNRQILVVTPEKLVYALRHSPEITASAGLIIFDEGHQFDSGTRGITYELLLTSLRSMLPIEAQKVFISAVISNVKAVGEWLNGAGSEVVTGTNLMPTFKSVGFASWLDQLGRIEYVSNDDVEKREFFVPRVIESFKLNNKPHERKDRIFPEKSDGQTIALFLGFKLVSNGSVAIFCGRKSTASSICEKALDAIERGIPLNLPIQFSDKAEAQRLFYLHERNLGSDAHATKSALHGIYSHHGNTPHGIRLAVEHAMREELIRFVICTSTLAQGVNLPIRYLIVTTVYQGPEQIKVRDFHNLIGRAGRAGMHTEGSILFADPVVYDKKTNKDEKWRWEKVKELLDPTKSEECVSSLFRLIPLEIRNDRSKAQDKRERVLTWDIIPFAHAYVGGWDELSKAVKKIVLEYGQYGFTEEKTKSQLEFFAHTLSSIESFLMSNWDVNGSVLKEKDISRLAEETLAFYLSDEETRQKILDLFKLLAKNIATNVSDPERRKAYGRTLYGIRDAAEIDDWVHRNIGLLLSAGTDNEILNIVWPLLAKFVRHNIFNKCDDPSVLPEFAWEWIQGKPFYEILATLQTREVKLIWGTKRREFKIDHVVEICEDGFAYDGALLIGAVCELIGLMTWDKTEEIVSRFQAFQKRIKYGLPTDESIVLYELGFSDRAVALDLASSLSLAAPQRKAAIRALKKNKNLALARIEKYPSYFHERLNEIISAN